MNLDFLGNTLFAQLAARFDDFFDGGQRSMSELEADVVAIPNDPIALNALGLRFLHDSKYELARIAFSQSLRYDSAGAFGRLGLACSLEAQWKPQSALEEVQHSLEAGCSYAAAVFAADYLARQVGADHISNEMHGSLV